MKDTTTDKNGNKVSRRGDGVRRRNKYGPALHQKAVELAEAGNYRSVIGRTLGVHEDTFFGWLRLGKEDPEGYPHFAQLLQDLEEAEAKWETEKVSQINAAADADPKHWTAAMTMLERKFPDRWGRRDHVTIEDSPVLQLNQVVLVDPGARAELRSVLRGITAGGTHLALGPGVGSESEEDGTGSGE